MKKLSIMLMGVFALGFAACDDAPVQPPVQTNPQPEMYEDSQISCAAYGEFAQSGVIDLNNYQTDKLGVPVVKFSYTDKFPAGGYGSAVMQISPSEDFGVYREVEVSTTDGIGYADALAWNDAHVELFGRARTERTVYYRLEGYVNVDGGIYRIGNDNTYILSGSCTEMCFDLGVAISEAYYFLSGATTWQLTQQATIPYLMYHSPLDPMDDPVFRFYVSVDGEQWWKIAPQEAISDTAENWDIVLGPTENGNTNEKGQMVEGSQSDKAAGCIKGNGTYCVEFDAISMTFNIYKVADKQPQGIPYLFTPGEANGWSMYASQWLAWNDDAKSFFGTVKVGAKDGFKLVSIVNGVNWGNPNWGGENGALVSDGPNIKPAADGLYWVVASPEALTYSLTEITSVGLIGVGGDWSNDIELTPTEDLLQWSATVDFSAEWKIRMNHNWDLNYGGSLENPVYNGGNISGIDGTHRITVNFAGNLPVITIE